MIQKRTVGIVGAGNVGIAAAYAMFLRQTAGELILVDKDNYRAEGEAMDLMHGQPYVGNISVRAGDYPDLGKTQVVVIAAGAAQRPGEKRTDLLNRNVDIFRKIVSQLDRYAPNAVIIVASNPVDILSYAIQELSDRPSQQIIGPGPCLIPLVFDRHWAVITVSIPVQCTHTSLVSTETPKSRYGAALSSAAFRFLTALF
jgi:L-lactate dehydrogenase